MTDFDGDGDVDILSATRDWAEGNFWTLVLHENTDGRGTFVEHTLVSNPTPQPVTFYTADLDGDKDMDVVTVSIAWGGRCPADADSGCPTHEVEIAWHENNGKMSLNDKQVIMTVPPTVRSALRYTLRVSLGDLDDDGDVDLLSYSSLQQSRESTPSGKIAWLENMDGKGAFGPEQVIPTETQGINKLAIADLDNDGDNDLLTSFLDGKIVWYESDPVEQPLRFPGDADENGVVAFSDFLSLSANFGKEADAVWADGDFDADGKVDFTDFLILSENFGASA